MPNQYKLDSQGKTTESAAREADKKLSGLVGKLKKAKADTSVTLAKKVLVGQYDLKTGIEPSTARMTSFTVRLEDPEDGWDELLEEAKKRSSPTPLESYESKFTIEQYLNLTNPQLKALETEKQRPTAGYSGRDRKSPLDVYRRL